MIDVTKIDVTKIDEAIRYLDFEPKKKFGGEYLWLAALLLAPYIVALVVLLVGTVLQAKG
jgi:hypothetical protein